MCRCAGSRPTLLRRLYLARNYCVRVEAVGDRSEGVGGGSGGVDLPLALFVVKERKERRADGSGEVVEDGSCRGAAVAHRPRGAHRPLKKWARVCHV